MVIMAVMIITTTLITITTIMLISDRSFLFAIVHVSPTGPS